MLLTLPPEKEREVSSMKEADLRDSVQKGHQDFLYINCCGAS
jgi:hypothetical protein